MRGYVTPTNPALKKRAAVEVVDFDDVNGVEFNDAAEIIDAEADVGFCDDVVETEWEGEEVQDGVFVSLDPVSPSPLMTTSTFVGGWRLNTSDLRTPSLSTHDMPKPPKLPPQLRLNPSPPRRRVKSRPLSSR